MNPLLVALLLACDPHASNAAECGAHHAEGACDHPASAQASGTPSNAEVFARGEKQKNLKPVALETLLASPAKFDGKMVAISGTVRKACTKMGCWMELAMAKTGPGVRVTFKDSAFFVPLDSAGKNASVEGTVKLTELSAARAQHYASEGAQVAKSSDGKYREVHLAASAVELR